MKRVNSYFVHSAQGVMQQCEESSACGAACGAADKPVEEQPAAACGSACGTGDK